MCIYIIIYIHGQTRYHAFWPISILTWYAARTPVRFRIPEQFSNGSALMMHSWAAVALWVKSNWGSSVLHHIIVLGITLFEVIFGLPRFLWRYTYPFIFSTLRNAQKRHPNPCAPQKRCPRSLQHRPESYQASVGGTCCLMTCKVHLLYFCE